MSVRTTLFFHYHPNDRAFFDALSGRLGRAFRQLIRIRHSEEDALIGADKQQMLQVFLREAHLFIPLVSQDYWNDDGTYEIHTQAMQRTTAGLLHLAPVLVRPNVDWEAEYAGRVVLPQDRKPISTLTAAGQENEYVAIARALQQRVEQIASSQPQTGLIDALAGSVFWLDYKEQKPEFLQHFGAGNLPLHIFFLRGAPQCGHHLLIDILRQMKDIRLETEPEPIPLDLASLKPEGLWREVRNALDMRDVSQLDRDGIARVILERLQIEPIVLRFDHFGKCDKTEATEGLREFWRQLNTYLSRPGQTVAHPILIFVNDEQRQFDYSEGDFECPDHAWRPDGLKLLKALKAVDPGDIDAWLNAIMVQAPYQPIWFALSNAAQPVIPPGHPDGLYMSQVIENVIDRLNLHPQKAEIMKRLRLI